MNIAFLLDKLDVSQLCTQLVYETNLFTKKYPSSNISLYIRYLEMMTIQPNVTMQNMINAWHFDGICISTSFKTTKILKNMFVPKKRFYYVMNPEWMFKYKMVDEYRSVFLDNDIDLIARSHDHADLITKMWKAPVEIIEDFNHDQIAEKLAKYS